MSLVKCADCGKEIPEHETVYCDMCRAPLCKECVATLLCSNCSNCTELWTAEIDLKDTEAEEQF